MTDWKSLDQVLMQLKQGDVQQRVMAAGALMFILREPERRAQALIAALADPDECVRTAAARSLGTFWPPVPAATPDLLVLLDDPDVAVRAEALRALGAMDPISQKAVAAVVAQLDDPQVCREAIDAIASMGEPGSRAVGWLARALRQQRHTAAAARALGRIGASAVAALPELCRALRSSDPNTRVNAAEAIGLIGPAAVQAVPVLLDLVDDQTFLASVEAKFEELQAKSRAPRLDGSTSVAPIAAGNLRAEAALALWRISRHERAVPLLIEVLGDANCGGRRAAADRLRRIGPPAAAAAQSLAQRACSDADSAVRTRSLNALNELGSAALGVMGALVYALGDEDGRVRGSAIAALGNLGPAAISTVDKIWKVIQEAEDPDIAAAFAVWQIAGDPAAIDVLIAGLSDTEDELRQQSAGYLEKIGAPARRALPALELLLDDDSELVAETAQDAIQQIREAVVDG